MKVKLPYIQAFKDRGGHMRYYFRRKGSPRVALPSPVENYAAFWGAYQEALTGRVTIKPRHGAGTLGALIVEYRSSAEFAKLRPESKRAYARVLDWLGARDGAKMAVDQITHAMIRRTRDELVSQPSRANITMSVVRTLMQYAVEMGYIDSNPAARVKPLATGEHRAWTADEHVRFLAHWGPGTMQRRIYLMAVCTGQRRSDLARITWNDRQDGVIHVKQVKTGEEVWVPEHRDLRAELATVAKEHVTILHSLQGSFTADGLGIYFAKAIKQAGLPRGCVLHGLRKSTATRIAEAGGSEREIMAITGHTTAASVAVYTRAADKKRLARQAVKKMEGGGS